MTEAEMKREVAVAFEYAYRQDDWVEPLDAVLEGLDAREASFPPAPSSLSIWAIVLHLALWNENIVERIERAEKSHPEESWPPVPAGGGAAEWEAAQTRLRESYEAVRHQIETRSLDELRGGYGLADLLCRFVHSGYHLGQIVKIREIVPADGPS